MSETIKTKPPRRASTSETREPQRGAATEQARVGVDDKSIAAASYANFCCITGTPQELIIDFKLDAFQSHESGN